MKRRFISLLTATALVLPCMAVTTPNKAMADEGGMVIRLDPSDASPFNGGEFQGWGTALCWWANRVGYSEKLTKQAADAFYSEEGLGLDIARYNLGGGDDPEHNHITRSDSKVPGVWKTFELSSDGKDVESITYDITKDQNQLNVALAAKQANPNIYFEGFSNSAPYFMTNSGCTSGADPADADNLKSDMYDDFAKFIADATKLFKDNGIVFESYSPMNEPDTNYWGVNSPKQEGCHFSPGTSQSNMIVATRNALDEAGLTDVLVAGMDETSLKKTANNLGSLTAEAKEALGRVDTHTYSDRNYHAQVKAKALELNKNLWQSEVDKGGNGLTLASMIIEDVNGMQPSAWVMWDIIDRHKDSNFTTPDGTKSEADSSVTDTTDNLWGVGMADHDNEELKLTNKYYCYGQFTKYINPGDTIIASSASTLAAYNKNSGDIKIVALNNTANDRNVTFDLRDFSKTGTTAKVIRTTDSKSTGEKWNELTPIAVTNKQFDATLKSYSVTTYVIEGDGAVDYMKLDGNTTIVAGVDYNYTAALGSSSEAPAVTWTVSDSEVADVTSAGVVRAKKGGQFTLTATTESGISTSIDITALDVDQNIRIVNKNSGLGLETKSQAVTSGSRLVQWQDRQLDTAAWKLIATEDGYFNIANANDNMLLANSEGSLVISNKILGTDDNAKWSLINHGGYYEIKNKGNGKSLDVSGQSTANGGSVILYTFGGGDNELWSFMAAADNLEHVVPAVVDYSAKYNGTKFVYVRNVPSATNDFNASDLNGFVLTGEAKLDSDSEGEPVLFPQSTLNNKNGAINAGTATLTLTEPITVRSTNIDKFEASAQGVSYKYTLPDAFKDKDKYFAIYDKSGALKTVTKNESEKTIDGDFTDAEYKLMVWDNGLKPYNYDEVINLSFDMYTPNSNGNSTFKLLTSDGEEIADVTGSNWGNTYSVTIGGEEKETNGNGALYFKNNQGDKDNNTRISNGGHVEVYYKPQNGAVMVTIKSVSNSSAVKSYTGTAAKDKDIGKIFFEGNYTSWNKKMAVDNLVTNIVTSQDKDFNNISESEAPDNPEPTDAPSLPENGELISLDFNDASLTSNSPYGKAEAEGSALLVTQDDKKCLQLNGANSSVIKLTDANGNALLTGQDEITISFKVKPTGTGTSWWFYAAPDDNAQTYQRELYLGAHTNGGNLNVERYQNSGSRSAMVTGAYTPNAWNDVIITVEKSKTTLYVNGVKTQADSSVDISEMLGKDSVAYIGKANWQSGEYATGYIDDFVITKGIAVPSVTMGDLSAVTSDITLPVKADDGTSAVTWSSSNTTVIANDGKVTRPIDTADVTLTATITKNGTEFTQVFKATVIGTAAVLDTFAAYAEDGKIKYTSGYNDSEVYNMAVTAKNAENTAVAGGDANTAASGSFGESLAKGAYTVTATLTDKTSGDAVKSVTRTVKVNNEQEMGAYLFAHFVGTESNANEEQIYFSVSTDGTTWKTLNAGNPVLTSTVGEKGVRDPYILRGEDGKFFVIATDLSIYNRRDDSNRWGTCQTSGSKNIVVWESEDLVNWSEPSLVKVAADNAGCTWAPETVYDPEAGQYMVFWASKVSTDGYKTQRVYRSYTSDFKTFTAPEIYIDGGDISNIDTTIISHKGWFYRFTKNETRSSVTMMKSTSLSGRWSDVDTYTLGAMTGYEGPTIYKLNGESKWCLLLDYYSKSQGYKPFQTNDLSEGGFTAASAFTFDTKYRHGTVMPITTEEYDALTAKYPASGN